MNSFPSVFISHVREKRMVTGTPVTTAEVDVVLFQILWKGTSERCHPRLTETAQALMHPPIYHDHAAKKTQTHITFQRFTQELEKRLSLMREENNFPANSPAVLLMDNVSSQIDKSKLARINSPIGFTIYHVADTHLYVLLGLPKRSHALNSGGQLDNRTLRDTCRQKAKLRLLEHCIAISDTLIAPSTPFQAGAPVYRCRCHERAYSQTMANIMGLPMDL